MRRLLIATTLAAAAITLAACAGGASVQRGEGSTLMAASGPSSAVMQALIVGTLATTESGCFAVDSGGVTYPLQFPYGTRLSDDGAAVTVPGMDPLEVGDPVRGGGGFTKISDPPAECEAENEHAEYAVWQTVED